MTHEELLAHLRYDPETGVFTRLIGQSASRAGTAVGSIKGKGYMHVGVCGKVFAAHRLAWFYMTGEWPKHEIDHLNGNRADNRFANLRDIPHGWNVQNRHRQLRTKSDLPRSGVPGVQWSRSRGTWISMIAVGKRRVFLGSFESVPEARAAYIAAKRKHHPGYVPTESAGIAQDAIDTTADYLMEYEA